MSSSSIGSIHTGGLCSRTVPIAVAQA
jgi:hypothetical protein